MGIEHDATLADLEESGRKVSSTRGLAEVGPRIGGFTILEQLGSGGMGIVLAAYDADLDRKVAIKMLRERPGSECDAARRQRFLREARALARLSHPNIVSVYEVGVDEGRPYIAMEHIEGQTLGAWAASQTRSWREVIETYLQAGQGLAACHRAGLIHRDVKPSNILIDARGRVRVTDFGLVRAAAEAAAEELDSEGIAPIHGPLDATLTNDGAVLGTPAYAAPEQLRGAPVDARADQFAFCVALHEALHGYRPGYGTPDPASDVPPAIQLTVKRGLDIDPAGRFESMDALLHALGDAADPKRSRKPLVLGALVLVLAVGVSAWVALRGTADSASEVQPVVTATLDSVAERPAAARAATPGKSSQLAKIELLTESGNDALGAGKVVEAEKKFAAAHELALKEDPLRLAEVKTGYAIVLEDAGRRPEARQLFEDALAIYKRTERREPWLESNTHEQLGAHHFEGGDNERARHHFAESLRIYEAAGLAEASTLANKLDNLGAALAGLERYDDALPLLERALSLRKNSKLREELPDSYRTLADLYRVQGNKKRARHYDGLRRLAIKGQVVP